MTLDVKKAASRKAMRVATVFTGAAACAVAFTPAAHAANLDPVRPAGTEWGDCQGANQSHWLHIVTNNSIYCLGGRGTYPLTDAPYSVYARVYSYCGGNNSGWFFWSYARLVKFYAGTTYNTWARNNDGFPLLTSEVSISTWHGNDTCSFLPPCRYVAFLVRSSERNVTLPGLVACGVAGVWRLVTGGADDRRPAGRGYPHRHLREYLSNVTVSMKIRVSAAPPVSGREQLMLGRP
jgi:hypothetical protein